MKKILPILLAAIMLSCSSSKITTSWKAKDEVPKQFNKIMVIALLKQNDGELKQLMENHLTGDLRKSGYNAISAYAEYGPKMFTGMSEEGIMENIRNKGFDAVITVVLLDKKQERQYVPRKAMYTPYYVYHNRFSDYYGSTYIRIESAGYYATTTQYFWESNFYDISSNKLLYSVQTESFQPSSINALAHEYGKMIVDDMLQKEVMINKQIAQL